jgi:glycosyltransferase involved in cell wall biosynthesis
MTDLSVWGIHDERFGGGPTGDDPVGKPSGCGYYRITLVYDQLAVNGWRVKYASGTPTSELDGYRLVCGQRLDRMDVLPDWRRLRARHRLVFELDDDVWHVNPINWNAYRVYRHESVQDTVEHVAATSDLVTVSTQPLAELMWPVNKNVVVLPNYVPEAMLSIERPRREHLTVGWAGGASHGEDLAIISPVMRRFLHENKQARMHIIGTDYRPTVGRIGIRYTDWAPEPADYYRLIDFDIGLAPVTGERFNACKSGIKAIEFMALGIPVIASDEEPYRDVITDGVTGFLVRSRAQWRSRLCELAADSGLREKMGAQAREAARAWTIEGNWHKWDAEYRKVLG